MKASLLSLCLAAYIALSSLIVFRLPQSIPAFLLFESSLLLVYLTPLRRSLKFAFALTVLAVLMPAIGTINGYYLEIAVQIGIFVALALGLNIVVGFAGLLNLGFVAFYAIGAYLWAIFGSSQASQFLPGGFFPLPGSWFFVFVILGALLGAGTGALLGLPVLRLRGDYLAVVTLGFAEVIRLLANNLDKPVNITNGPRGITPIQRPPLFFQPLLDFFGVSAEPAMLYPIYFYFIVLFIVGLILFINGRLERCWIGRAWKAIREDEVAAATMGIPVVRMKLLAFALGASFAAAVGVLFAAKQSFINPESFTFMESIGVLAMVILGGIGSTPGAIFGATLVTILNLQLLKGLSLWLNEIRQSGIVLSLPLLGSYDLSQIPVQFEPAKYERMVFGLILIFAMIYMPAGMFPSRRGERKSYETARG